MTQGILTGVLILALAAALLPGLYYLNRLRRMQKLLRERRMCLLNLEEKLLNEDWVYFNGCGDGEYAE